MCLRPLAIVGLECALWHLLFIGGRYIGSDALPNAIELTSSIGVRGKECQTRVVPHDTPGYC